MKRYAITTREGYMYDVYANDEAHARRIVRSNGHHTKRLRQV